MDFGLNGITAFLLGISTQLILVYALFRQWFRFSVKTTLLVVAILKIMELYANEFVTDETRWILAILAVLQTLLLIPLMKKGTRRLMLIIFMIYAFIYNAFGGIVISSMTTVYGILAGKSNQTWFVGATMTQADFVLKWTGAILCYAAAILICRKCIHLLEYLSEGEKWFFSLGFIIPDALCMLSTRIFATTSEAQLGGLLVVMYAIYLGWLAILVTLTLVTSLIRLRRENCRLQQQMEEESEYYQKVLKKQMQLREIRHDLKNRLVAETVAKEDRLRAKKFEDV